MLCKYARSYNLLRARHGFWDFAWATFLGFTPELIALYAIGTVSLFWMILYLGAMLPFGVLEVLFLCRHCPYYRQEQGRAIHCKSLWGPVKYIAPRPGAPARWEKAVLYSFFAIGFAFPIYWLAMQPMLLVLYFLTIIAYVWTLARYECSRCISFGCPFNMVDKGTREEFLSRQAELMAAGGESVLIEVPEKTPRQA
ncbi:MAG: hypothetical protein IBX68_02675 [Dehalococcoidia bacterium]|nr:hypothetical protein [Dehalococcoidia bacterium]